MALQLLPRLVLRHCFYIFLFMSVDPVHALYHGPALGVVVAGADLDWTKGGGATYRRSTSFFVHGGDGIGLRGIAYTSASSPLLSIFIQQMQASP